MTVDLLPAPTQPVDLDRAWSEGMACALLLGALRRFDWPCACGHTSDQCSKREDGRCDG